MLPFIPGNQTKIITKTNTWMTPTKRKGRAVN